MRLSLLNRGAEPVVLVLPGQPIPIGRPYRTQLDGVLKMLTAKKSVGSLPTLRLESRYPSDSSSFDSPFRYSSSGYATSDSLDDSSTATSARPSHKRCRSPTSSVPAGSPVRGALSLVRVDLSPPPKRIRDFDSVTDMEVGLRVDSKDSYEPYTEPDTDSDIQENIDECIAYADAIRARGMDDRDVVEIAAEEEVGSRERYEDVLDHVIADRAMKVTYDTLGGSGHRITGVDLEVTTMTERISALERDNTRLRGMLDVESQRVDRLQRGLSRAQRELRQIRRFRFYDRVQLGRLDACSRRHLGYRH
ncbi:hypothetical protein Tco_1281582 [Tanacetum coccineum]